MRTDLDRIPEYVPGKSIEEIKRKYGLNRVIKLASNENPYGCSPKVLEAVKDFKEFHIYPPPDSEELRERISEYTGFDAEMIVLSAGMDGVLEGVFKMLIDVGDVVAYAIPTFQYYSILSRIYRARESKLKRNSEFKMIEFDENAKLTVICSPNNPTGNVEDESFVKEVVESVKGYIFIDEAYAEFTEKQLLKFAEYENVIIGRTFSKAFGLANLRIGYGIMHPDLRKTFMKVNTPFPLSTISIRAAIAALEDIKWMKDVVKRIIAERERLFEGLSAIANAVRSEANFIFFETGHPSEIIARELEKRGVIIRSLKNFEGASNRSLRVTVGKPEENEIFLNALREVLCSL